MLQKWVKFRQKVAIILKTFHLTCNFTTLSSITANQNTVERCIIYWDLMIDKSLSPKNKINISQFYHVGGGASHKKPNVNHKNR